MQKLLEAIQSALAEPGERVQRTFKDFATDGEEYNIRVRIVPEREFERYDDTYSDYW